MQKFKRKKLIRAKLEALLEKYGRRMQRLAAEAYEVRQALEGMDVKAEPTTPTEESPVISTNKEKV